MAISGFNALLECLAKTKIVGYYNISVIVLCNFVGIRWKRYIIKKLHLITLFPFDFFKYVHTRSLMKYQRLRAISYIEWKFTKRKTNNRLESFTLTFIFRRHYACRDVAQRAQYALRSRCKSPGRLYNARPHDQNNPGKLPNEMINSVINIYSEIETSKQIHATKLRLKSSLLTLKK